MSTTIDIKYKCHNGKSFKSKCACKDNDLIEATGGRLKDAKGETDYKYCTHRYNSYELWISQLKYGGTPLQIRNDGEPTLFSDEHHKVWEVTAYYHKDHDNGRTTIRVPLALRVLSKTSKDHGGSEYYWYENTGTDGDNITWKAIINSDTFPEDDTEIASPQFKDKLIKLTCDLHKLHIVNIHAQSSYDCACGRANVTVIPEEKDSVPGYKNYRHEYETDVNTVRYKNVILEDDDGYGPIELTLEHTPNLSAYYWEKDTKHKKPLLMEVTLGGNFGGEKVFLSNDGEPNNGKWNMIMLEDELKDKLQELKCELFHPVIIDVSQTGPYLNPYYKNEMNGQKCTNLNCPGTVQVKDYDKIKLGGYTAFRHIYGKEGDTFTITEFTGEPKIHENKLPIWDVNDVVVFFPDRDNTNAPPLVYVSSDGGRTKKWYSRTSGNNGDKLEEVWGRLGNNPPNTASNLLKATLDIIKQLQEILQRSEGSVVGPELDEESEDEEEEGEYEPKKEPEVEEQQESETPSEAASIVTPGPVVAGKAAGDATIDSDSLEQTQPGAAQPPSEAKGDIDEVLKALGGIVGETLDYGLDVADALRPVAVTAVGLTESISQEVFRVLSLSEPGKQHIAGASPPESRPAEATTPGTSKESKPYPSQVAGDSNVGNGAGTGIPGAEGPSGSKGKSSSLSEKGASKSGDASEEVDGPKDKAQWPPEKLDSESEEEKNASSSSEPAKSAPSQSRSDQATNTCGVSNPGALVINTDGNGCIALLSTTLGPNVSVNEAEGPPEPRGDLGDKGAADREVGSPSVGEAGAGVGLSGDEPSQVSELKKDDPKSAEVADKTVRETAGALGPSDESDSVLTEHGDSKGEEVPAQQDDESHSESGEGGAPGRVEDGETSAIEATQLTSALTPTTPAPKASERPDGDTSQTEGTANDTSLPNSGAATEGPAPSSVPDAQVSEASERSQFLAQKVSGSGPGTPGLGHSHPGSQKPGTDSDSTPNIIVSVTTGILGTSALACFTGWKLYNRYKGDPWVRQI